MVVAKVGSEIAKVQCKQCGGYHRLRTSASTPRKRAPAVRNRRTSPRVPAAVETAVDPDLTRPVRRYQISERYQPGDRIAHPVFGEGVVEAPAGSGKIQVRFGADRRLLAEAKSSAELPAPPPRTFPTEE